MKLKLSEKLILGTVKVLWKNMKDKFARGGRKCP